MWSCCRVQQLWIIQHRVVEHMLLLPVPCIIPAEGACWRSVDIKGTFEAKGITNAKSRLQFVAAEVRSSSAISVPVRVTAIYCHTNLM